MAITYVGKTWNGVLSGANVPLTLSDITGLATGDIVVVAYVIGDDDNTDFTMSIATGTGWTKIVDSFSNDTKDTNLGVFWKIMGLTPDTSVTVDGQGGTDAGTACIAMAFRGVDQANPIDVETVIATGVDTLLANPPSINHSGLAGTAIIAIGSSGNSELGSYVAPSGYSTNFTSTNSPDSTNALIGMGYNLSPSDPEDPNAFTFDGDDGTGYSWCACTIALRPASTPSTSNFFQLF